MIKTVDSDSEGSKASARTDDEPLSPAKSSAAIGATLQKPRSVPMRGSNSIGTKPEPKSGLAKRLGLTSTTTAFKIFF